MFSILARGTRLPLLAVAATAALVGSVVTVESAAASPSTPAHTPAARKVFNHPDVLRNRVGTHALPAGVPEHGRHSFLLRLGTASTLATYRQVASSRGKSVARTAAKSQFARIKDVQAAVVRQLPAATPVIYKTHSVLAGVAVRTDVRNYGALQRLRGVEAVYPIATKTLANSYAVPLVHAPQVWAAAGNNLGADSTIAIIDTGIDYTHANLGGSGDTADWDAEHATSNDDPNPSFFPNAKVIGGYDFAGDDYWPNETLDDGSENPDFQPDPHPDNNPLDCNGHGSHVAGTAAGYGETTDGSTFDGDYTTLGALSSADYRDLFRIGPGMAPHAQLLAYKVFGCEGSSDVVGQAIDRAGDPDDDGDPSDHVDVINMSLGGDYGSPLDADSIASNAASQLGISVVAASGNGGDFYDVGGAPADAVRAIAVANTVDAYNQIDSLHANFGAVAQSPFGATRSVLYTDWATDDLEGDVKRLTQTNNTDACDPVTQDFTGKVAFVEWTDDDAVRRCGSITRANNLEAAGAVGFIFADDQEVFSAGINGNENIPGVLVVKSAGDAIRTALTTPVVVHVTGTSAGDFSQLVPGDDDKVNTGSSRGIRGAGNVKPDVSAVGTNVFSTAVGTGDQGVSFSGTSMATPMVAGLAALIHTAHSDWTAEEIKADIMNSAGQDLFTGANHTGTTYAPNRVGAGRIQADSALDNLVLAYVQDNPGAVSVSFGPVAVTGPTTLTKTVKVVNKDVDPVSYTLAYQAITSVPGVSYQISPTTLALDPGQTKTFTVKFVVTNATALTKTHDATVAMTPGDLQREFLADASGRVVLTPTSGATVPLRVPVYSAPRPASTMTEAGSLTLPGSGVQLGSLKLTGQGVDQGSGLAKVRSFVSGFELQAKSGFAPTCASAGAEGCVHYADERSGDLKYVGFTSDSPRVQELGGSAIGDGQAYFSITTQKPWRTPVGLQEFDILIDTNRDNTPDAVVYNTRIGDTFLSELLDISDPDPANWFIRDDELINDRLGNSDTALFDSDTLVLPIWVKALGAFDPDGGVIPTIPALPGFNATHTRINYAVQSFGATGLIDSIGLNANGTLNAQRLSVDVIRPGVEMYNDSILNPPTTGLLLNNDQNGKILTVRRDVARYNLDKALGALLVHFHNAVGSKAKLLTLKTAPKVSLSFSPRPVESGRALKATMRVANTAGRVPTGTVTLRRASGARIGGGTLVNGAFTFTWHPVTRGTFAVYASYSGDTNYASGRSTGTTYRVI